MTVSLGSLPLFHGQSLNDLRMAYELEGPKGAPVLVVMGGISAHRFVTDQSNGQRGWWNNLFGPGKTVNTQRFQLLSFDFLGGSGDSTGPLNYAGAPENFPQISTWDQARALARLLDHLQIERVHAVIGASYGGMVGLALACLFPTRASQLQVISASHKNSPWSIALRKVQREILSLGLEMGQPERGLALARGLAMTTYKTEAEFRERFSGARTDPTDLDSFPVWNYIRARGEAFTHRMDSYTYMGLSRSIDLHQVDPGEIRVPLIVVAVRQDMLVPPEYCEELVRRSAGPSELIVFDSIYGHDAFLKDEGTLAGVFRQHLNLVNERSETN